MIKILIVEDELIIAQDMIDILEKMGYEVMENAMDAEETFEILSKDTPDLIILDINLSGGRDGIDIAKEINEKYKIPFIFDRYRIIKQIGKPGFSIYTHPLIAPDQSISPAIPCRNVYVWLQRKIAVKLDSVLQAGSVTKKNRPFR